MNKPDGLTVVTPDQCQAFIDALPIDQFFGVGKVTAKKFRNMGIFTGSDLRRRSKIELERYFGKAGRYYYHICQGEDNRPVRTRRRRKSIGAERTFFDDVTGKADLEEKLQPISDRVAERMERLKASCKTVTLKIKYHDFRITTRSKTLPESINGRDALWTMSRKLLHKPELPARPVRLLGISVSNLTFPDDPHPTEQLPLDFSVTGEL